VLNRRKAVIGSATYMLARYAVRRQIRHKLSRLRPARSRDGKGGPMLSKTKGTADRATALVDQVRPIVARAIHDAELHEAIRQAFNTGREVQSELQGEKPADAARKLARDRKLQRKVETSANELQKAVTSLKTPPRSARWKAKVRKIAIIGAVAGAAVLVMKKMRARGGDELPY
jgi:hypothetical protein